MTEKNLIARYLDTELIALRSPARSQKKLLQTMAQLLSSGLNEPNERAVYQCLIEREKLGNTGIGNGIALPHSRCNFTDDAIIGLITLEDSIDYDSPDKVPVNIAFGLLVPEQAHQDHLNLLAEIARMMSDQNNQKKLLQAKTPEQVIDMINTW